MRHQRIMKQDDELKKIAALMTTIIELERRMYAYCEGDKQSRRIRDYITSRYGYFFDWIQQKDV